MIENFYEVTSLVDAVVIYERTPEGAPLTDVLRELLHASDRAEADLIEVLNDLWFDRDCLESRYGEDPWFIQTHAFPWSLSEAWEMMERSLRSEARFVNPVAAKTLQRVFDPVLVERTAEGRPLILEVGPGYDLNLLYRARVFQTIDAMETALGHPERHLGPPPPGIGAAGRMNAKGVAVFYGSTKQNTAISEVRPPVGSHVVVGAFKIIRPLRLLDLTQLGSVQLDPSRSFFDSATVDQANRCRFLGHLAQKLTMPVMPELVDDGYLMTQVIADYLATHPGLELDGIFFPSVQSAGTSAASAGHNIILFRKASSVLRAESRYDGTADVNLWEHEEEHTWFEPQIWTRECAKEEPNGVPKWIAPDEVLPALELDRDAIDIHEVRGIEFTTEPHNVKHGVRVAVEIWKSPSGSLDIQKIK
ncbi:RES family NAD+ phosphorylase [Cupriavidus basilensis]